MLFLDFLKGNSFANYWVVFFDLYLSLDFLSVFAGVVHIVTFCAFHLYEILLWHIFLLYHTQYTTQTSFL